MGWVLLVAALILAACGGEDGPQSAQPAADYQVTVTRTRYGIPHVNAPDLGSLGYGYGYAFAQDNLCTMMEDFVAIRGERSRYWGGDGTYVIPAVEVAPNNVDSDFFWKFMADAAAVRRFRDAASPEVRRVVHGFVDGFNRYIEELQAGEHPGEQAACAEAPYLAPITDEDMYRRFIRLAIVAGSEALITEIATAAPPGFGAAVSPEDPARQIEAFRQMAPEERPFGRLRRKGLGSNMYALGPDATGGEPILFGNPHFPWVGTERFYLAHLTLPGTIDIAGVSLFGAPVVMIGFNDRLAWSHTVSTAYRFTMYRLSLSQGNPTRYVYEGRAEDMKAVPLSVEVLNPDGSTGTRRRTLYRSRYGPMFVLKVGKLPVLGWSRSTAFTLRDANFENDRILTQFFAWNKAQGLDEFKRLHASVLGVPWVNTVASGPGGDAYYGDVSVVPNVTDEQAMRCAALQRARGSARAGPAAAGRKPRRVSVGHRPGRAGAGHLRAGPPAHAGARGLGRQHERQLLAHQPGPAGDRLQPHHRRRRHRAVAAHAQGDPPDPEAARRLRRLGRPEPIRPGETEGDRAFGADLQRGACAGLRVERPLPRGRGP
jgi:acyl-homoserine-lactone acylase